MIFLIIFSKIWLILKSNKIMIHISIYLRKQNFIFFFQNQLDFTPLKHYAEPHKAFSDFMYAYVLPQSLKSCFLQSTFLNLTFFALIGHFCPFESFEVEYSLLLCAVFWEFRLLVTLPHGLRVPSFVFKIFLTARSIALSCPLFHTIGPLQVFSKDLAVILFALKI